MWPAGIQYDKVRLLLTDGVAYMIKSGSNLKVFYPNLIHLTCLAHGLSLVSETVRNASEDVDHLIANGKKVFLKAPSRVEIYRETLGSSFPLPPQPIVTRWGTWLRAANFYAENLEKFREVNIEL